LPRTASTLLQEAIFEPAPGLTYVGRPHTQTGAAFNRLQYVDDSLFDPTELSRAFETIRHGAGGRPIVISDELLSGFPFFHYLNRAPIAQRLAAAVPDAEVVLFLRAQPDLIASTHAYYASIGQYTGPLDDRFLAMPGEGTTLEAWFGGDRSWPTRRLPFFNRTAVNVEHFRFSRLLALYHGLFPRVHVLLYEQLRDEPAACIERLSGIVGADLGVHARIPAQPVNARIDDDALHRALVTNRLATVSRRFSSGAGRHIASALAGLYPSRVAAGREWAKRAVASAGLLDDNRAVSAEWGLGMERWASAYFGAARVDDL
jgi:hypothetical protein